jgi:hypothetical protein
MKNQRHRSPSPLELGIAARFLAPGGRAAGKSILTPQDAHLPPTVPKGLEPRDGHPAPASVARAAKIR